MPRHRSRHITRRVVEAVLIEPDPSEGHNASCIDLTEDGDASIIDLTNTSTTNILDDRSNDDSAVVVLGSDTFVSPRRRRQISRDNRRNPNDDVTFVSQTSPPPVVDISEVSSSGSSSMDSLGASSLDDLSSPTQTGITCPVCLESRTEIERSGKSLQVTFCGHVFCDICIRNAVQIHKCCPKCRKRLNMKQVLPLFI